VARSAHKPAGGNFQSAAAGGIPFAVGPEFLASTRRAMNVAMSSLSKNAIDDCGCPCRWNTCLTRLSRYGAYALLRECPKALHSFCTLGGQ
jgi:hypothetical protein